MSESAKGAEATIPITVEEMVAKCMSIGLIMYRAPSFTITHPPITLQPTLITKSSFEFVTTLQPVWNRTMDAVARDYGFLHKSLATCAASDVAFTGRLLGMLRDVYGNEHPVQEAMLGIFRTDYMRDHRRVEGSEQEWKNVELNTISCSFAALASKANQFHAFVNDVAKAELGRAVWEGDVVSGRSEYQIPAALAAAHSLFLETEPICSDREVTPVVVFVIQENERNTGDQYQLAFHLLQRHNVRSIRRTMTQLADVLTHVPNGARPPLAIIEGKYVASVFYFRCAYVPQDFKTELCWTSRLLIEQSSAIKCPSVPYHLAGFKKIQQLLSVDSVLKEFCPNPAERSALQSTFMSQSSLDADEVGPDAVDEKIADAMAHPRKYVLKPQLEGGGNLYASSKLVEVLSRPEDDPMYQRLRKEFILMERIEFPKTSGAILRFGEIISFKDNLCCELGVFGTILATRNEIRRNEFDGTLVRTKPADVDDGGVMAGVAALDSLSII